MMILWVKKMEDESIIINELEFDGATPYEVAESSFDEVEDNLLPLIQKIKGE